MPLNDALPTKGIAEACVERSVASLADRIDFGRTVIAFEVAVDVAGAVELIRATETADRAHRGSDQFSAAEHGALYRIYGAPLRPRPAIVRQVPRTEARSRRERSANIGSEKVRLPSVRFLIGHSSYTPSLAAPDAERPGCWALPLPMILYTLARETPTSLAMTDAPLPDARRALMAATLAAGSGALPL